MELLMGKIHVQCNTFDGGLAIFPGHLTFPMIAQSLKIHKLKHLEEWVDDDNQTDLPNIGYTVTNIGFDFETNKLNFIEFNETIKNGFISE